MTNSRFAVLSGFTRPIPNTLRDDLKGDWLICWVSVASLFHFLIFVFVCFFFFFVFFCFFLFFCFLGFFFFDCFFFFLFLFSELEYLWKVTHCFFFFGIPIQQNTFLMMHTYSPFLLHRYEVSSSSKMVSNPTTTRSSCSSFKRIHCDRRGLGRNTLSIGALSL